MKTRKFNTIVLKKKRGLATKLFAIKIRKLKLPGEKRGEKALWCRDSVQRDVLKLLTYSFYVKDRSCSILHARSVVPAHAEMNSLHEVFFITGKV